MLRTLYPLSTTGFVVLSLYAGSYVDNQDHTISPVDKLGYWLIIIGSVVAVAGMIGDDIQYRSRQER